MAGFSDCAGASGRGAALAEGRRAGYPTPIVRAVSCYETRRAREEEGQERDEDGLRGTEGKSERRSGG